MRQLAVVVAVVAGLLALSAPAHAARTVYSGQWQCDDRGTVLPLGGIELQLWRRGGPDFLPVEWVGGIDDRGFTDADGRFALRATDPEDTHFVRMALRDAAGVRLKDFWGINDWSIDSVGLRNDVAAREVGGLLLSTPGQSHKCAIWRGLHLAHQEFRTITGTDPPSGGLLVNADAITAGVPFTPHTTIMWPGGFPAGYGGGGDDSITRHEFGHVVRHGYDGDAGHFLGDVVTHNYLQTHEACQKTNPGFAFNEGWAEYWARDYGPAPACPGRAPDDFEVEGNVAAALTDIETRCYSGRRAAMVAILRANRGVIHSYRDFLARVVCPAPVVAAPPPPIRTAPLRISLAEGARIARAQVSAVDARLRRLGVQLQGAVRRAANPPACASSPCTAALRGALLPAVLRTEIALARMVRAAVDDQDTVKEQAALRKLSIRASASRMATIATANRRRAAKVSADGIGAALRAGRRVFAADTSAASRRLRRLLTTRLATFRRAQRSGAVVPGLLLDEAVVDRIRRVAPQTFAPPAPQPPAPQPPTPQPPAPQPPAPQPPPPAADTRETSELTLTCPGGGKVGGIAGVGGTLTPVHAGVDVELRITPPGEPETIQTTKTTVNGTYNASVNTTKPGTWTITARWAGDADTKPAESSSCGILVGL